VLAAGISGAGFVGIAGSLAASPPSVAGSPSATVNVDHAVASTTTTTTTTIVEVEVVHEVIYVDYSKPHAEEPPATTNPSNSVLLTAPVTVAPKPPACSGTSC
jgi:hypothetical protein